MGLFSKRIGPVFLKETSDAAVFIEKMQEMQKKANGELAQTIEKQINIAKYGELGENNIVFELKNSGMDMYILRDIYLESEGLSAQIDFLVITRHQIYVIECKNLIGNIEIDNTGAFKRSYQLYNKSIKEGIYSPITQNQRHLQVLKQVRKNSKGNILTKILFEKYFDENYQSIIVLANPKTYLYAKYAPKAVKEQVIRADQLISYIKQKDTLYKESSSDTHMLELAQFYLEQNQPERSDYAQKYAMLLKELEISESKAPISEITEDDLPDTVADTYVKKDNNKENLIVRLKEFRLSQSRKENIKPYYIFNDAQMNDLLEKAPHNKVELLQVSGFGDAKVEKYGEEILKILWQKQ